MAFFSVINKTVLVLLLGFTATAHAQNKHYYVKCPKLDMIHQAAPLMKYTQCRETSCIVYSDNAVINKSGLNWGLMILNPISASSTDEAILKAQNIAAEVSVMGSKITFPSFIGYWCSYFVTSSNQEDQEMIVIVAVGSDKNSLMHTLLR